MREAWIAEQPRLLVAQRRELGDDAVVVVLAAVVAARDPGAEHLLAQIPPGRELQERLDTGAAERHGVLPFQTAILGRPARCGAGEIRQADEVVFAERQHIRLLVGEHVLAETGAKRREPVADVLQPLLRRGVEACPGAAEQRVVAFQHARLLACQAETRGVAMQRVELREQLFVEVNLIPVPGKFWRHVALDRLDRLAGVGAGQHIEHVADPHEQPARAFQRLDRVGERWLRLSGRDDVDFGAVRGKRLLEGGREMLRRDRLQRRDPERRRPFGEQRVFRRIDLVRRFHGAYLMRHTARTNQRKCRS